MSLLSIVSSFAGRNGIPAPSTVIGNTDTNVIQILRLLEEEGNDLCKRGNWNVLTREATHTTLAAADQGAIASIAPIYYRNILNDTIWDRSGKMPIYVIDDEDWQAIQAMVMTGTPYRYRLRGGRLLATPTPTAGLTWAFEYISSAWILNGSTPVQYFVADTDTMLLPEDLILQGLRWRYMREKGLEYAELYATYEKQVEYALATERTHPRLNAVGCTSRAPGVFIPAISWITP